MNGCFRSHMFNCSIMHMWRDAMLRNEWNESFKKQATMTESDKDAADLSLLEDSMHPFSTQLVSYNL